ncbi:MAG: DUF5779 family protein [Halobacteriales archaeon]
MGEFDLDLDSIEREFDAGGQRRLVLGVLDGSTSGEEWLDEVRNGNVLILDIEGELEELAADFAGEIKAGGGSLVHFRGFLLVTPPEIEIDRERLQSAAD